MNWDAITGFAELVGAAAVVITLIYLAIQMRHNSNVMRASAIWDSQISFVAINETLADGGTISEIMYRVLSETDGLTPYEKHLAHRFLRGFLQRVEAQFALYTNGILDNEVWELRRGYVHALMDNPLIKEYWELDKQNTMFTKAFIEEIDNAPRTEIAGFMGVSPSTKK